MNRQRASRAKLWPQCSVLFGLALALGCQTQQKPKSQQEPARAIENGPSLAELRRLMPPANVAPNAEPALAPLIGSCSAGTPLLADGSPDPEGVRPVGELTKYSQLVRIRESDFGFVRARADAQWAADESRNILGYLPAGSFVWAEGPLKNAAVSAGPGFAVPVRDLSGRSCRVYISQTVIEERPRNP
jgi:hypothetical protein